MLVWSQEQILVQIRSHVMKKIGRLFIFVFSYFSDSQDLHQFCWQISWSDLDILFNSRILA